MSSVPQEDAARSAEGHAIYGAASARRLGDADMIGVALSRNETGRVKVSPTLLEELWSLLVLRRPTQTRRGGAADLPERRR